MSTPENRFRAELQTIEQQGLYKRERVITTPQGVAIATREAGEVLNFCANNYLGLANHPELVRAAIGALETRGFGMASVRFICGTQDLHKELEQAIADFLQTDDAILYTSCFDANTGLFETLLSEQDAVISDQLNHASVIDGIRLCKAARYRYRHGDMEDLEVQLQAAAGARTRLIATDGVFSMDGYYAKLDQICDLADKYNALVMVDDSHATGFIGRTGRGTPELCGVLDRIDVMTSTLGKAMGGASGGFTTGRAEIIEFLRQRSRPYLFSNTLAPPIVMASMASFNMLDETTELRDRLEENTRYFREGMKATGFEILPGSHPIVPVMLGDAKLAHDVAHDMLERGVYVIGFSYPVVPKGQARIRVQVSAAHEKEHLDRAINAFKDVGKARGIL
jgi:glycine C-acetyltransferase